ncbi:MAG: class I SAM-dependent methyltransferase, partial [Rhodospirillales bacterium]|nr:class I SAM-dependent methyltransferase [Rhodospirillales bacterium]
TEVRALAYRAMGKAEGLRMEKEIVYDSEVRRESFEAFREGHILISPERESIFREKDAEVRESFHRLGEKREDGYIYFLQPMRVNLLRKT